MSRAQEKVRLRKHRQRDAKVPDYAGLNRRTTGLLPRPKLVESSSLAVHLDSQRAEQFLLAIEANQTTCCIYTSSAYYKSRSAALVFRGRVLGCVYGNKVLDHQLFGSGAYDYMHRELSHKDTTLDAYLLDEGLALAAASMFHGTVLDPPDQGDPEASFRSAFETLRYYNRPGAIFILDELSQAIFSAYVFKGKTVGAFSFEDGWLNPEYESAEPFLKDCPDARIFGGMLSAGGIEEAERITFSLSGLADRRIDAWTGFNKEEVSNVMLIGFAAQQPQRPPTAIDINRFVPRFRSAIPTMHRPVAIANPFKINPLTSY
jgi:hypothetical protein